MLRSTSLSVLALALLSLATECNGAEDTVTNVAEQISLHHANLMHIQGGITINFVLDVDQVRGEEFFLYAGGSKGTIALKWPKLYVSLTGRHSINGQSLDREGQYDFETQLGAGRQGAVAQITPYRHQWSAVTLLPLIYLFFDECDQKYVPGEQPQSSRWLPSCLETRLYSVKGTEILEGAHCVVLAAADGKDIIYVDKAHGYQVAKREIYDAKHGLLKERAINQAFVKVTDDVWLPGTQVYEYYNYSFKHTKRTHQYTYKTTLRNEFVLGHISRTDIEIPNLTQVDDQLRRINYVKARGFDKTFLPSFKQARSDMLGASPVAETRFPWGIAIALSFFSLFMSVVSTVLKRQAGVRRA